MRIKSKLFQWLVALSLSLSLYSCTSNATDDYKKGFADGYSKAKAEQTNNSNNTNNATTNNYNNDKPNKVAQKNVSNTGNVPAYALETLRYIEEHNEAPQGYVGARVFKNFEGNLPKKGDNGESLKYQEWDVHPKVEGQNRGAERLVTSSDKHAYFTANHYKSFIKIK